ncbi:unnamed protein product [Schistosoma turkestanicum]|nr:unnamed protein product [Schistosoma turkestanicum]
MENDQIDVIENPTDAEVILSSREDCKEPVRRVRPDACRRSMQARRCVQHLRKLTTCSSNKQQFHSTIDDNQYHLSYELFNSIEDPGACSLNLSDNNHNNNNINNNCSQSSQYKNILSYKDYLALPIEIRYPYNYVSDLFEDAHPEHVDLSRSKNNNYNFEE